MANVYSFAAVVGVVTIGVRKTEKARVCAIPSLGRAQGGVSTPSFYA